MGANLFIDTNVLLSFYHFSSDDLTQLNKLAELVESRTVLLLVPEQVSHEFRRNRDAKIADALKGLKSQTLSLQYPQMCKDYDEYARLRELQLEYGQLHAQLVEKILGDAGIEQLTADEIVYRLFLHAQKLPTTPEILALARNRMDLGNPPGKSGSFGDAVNWESLLEGAPGGQTLHFVTDDSDYWSKLNPNAFNSFLMDEWTEYKEAALHAHRRLSDFFREDFPQIRLADETKKDAMIEALAASPNFQTTHMLTAQLRDLRDFTASQANSILVAALDNAQVGGIAGDSDVKALLRGLIRRHEDQIDAELIESVVELIGPEPELPF